MCNVIHEKHKAIEKTGFGWKLFTIRKGKFYPLCKTGYFTTPTKEWVVWDKENVNNASLFDSGFCFFLDEEEARYVLHNWRSGSLRKIVYRKGICKQVETAFMVGESIEIALCKEFKILKKGEEK